MTRKYTKVDPAVRDEILAYAKAYSVSIAAKKYNVSRQVIKYWKQINKPVSPYTELLQLVEKQSQQLEIIINKLNNLLP